MREMKEPGYPQGNQEREYNEFGCIGRKKCKE